MIQGNQKCEKSISVVPSEKSIKFLPITAHPMWVCHWYLFTD